MKKGTLLIFGLLVFLFSISFVSALEIEKQDIHINVFPNQLVCFEREIKTDNPAYVLFSSDSEAVQIKSIENKDKNIKINSALRNDLEEIADKENSFNDLAFLSTAYTHKIKYCYQIPDFETLKELKHGKFSYCAFELTLSPDNYVTDCENSVWWNFDYGYRQKVIFYSNQTNNNVSKCIDIEYNSLMALDFSDLTFARQNDRDNFSETEEAWYLQSKDDEVEATYCVNVFTDMDLNVSGVTNETHYFYYDADIDNSGKSCYGCINWSERIYFSPFAWWHLNEANGTNAFDSSGNNRNGTLINMEDGDWVAGKLNNSLQFDGVNEYIYVENNINENITNEITIEAWIYPSVSGDKEIIIKSNAYTLKLDKVGGNLFASGSIFSSSTEYIATSTTSMILNNWYHIVMTFRNSYVYLYQDNVQEGQSTQCAFCKIDTNNNNITLGGNPTYFNGKIDEAVIYDFALNSNQISDRYNNGNGTEEMIILSEEIITNITYEIFSPEPTPILITCEYSTQPYLNKPIKWLCKIPDNETYKCNSYSYDINGTLINANPKPVYIDGIGAISYFSSFPTGENPQLVNIEFDTAGMPSDTPIHLKIICKGSERLIKSRMVTPQFKELTESVDFFMPIMNNPAYYIGLFFILLFLIVIFFILLNLLKGR